MPSHAKFSPLFHEVSPEIVPLHSFCQIFLPMRRASAPDRELARSSHGLEITGTTKISRIRERKQPNPTDWQPWLTEKLCHLDEGALSISMPLPCFGKSQSIAKQIRYL